ncbi:MAG: hypothetical protein WD556_07660 [Actinomycetota bacterium]
MAAPQEVEVAAWIAELVKRQFGIVVGPPTERDGNDETGLTNDFTFDSVTPPLALEVTRLRDDFESPSPDDLGAMRKRLEGFLSGTEWPHWSAGIRPETKLRSDLEPAIKRMIEWMQAANLEKLGPGTYMHDVPSDLLYRMGDTFVRDCHRAQMAGAVLITRNEADGLRIVPVAEFSDSKSLLRPLTRALSAKEKSLALAKKRGYVTILGVDVEREDTTGYLAEGVRAPGFPRAVDHLWLCLREASKVFYAKRDERRFRMFDLPE